MAGIELSPAMVDQLRAKDGADRIAVTIGDMTSIRVAGEFRLVYLVYNTIGNVMTARHRKPVRYPDRSEPGSF